MTFCFPVNIGADWDEKQIRAAIRDYVDHFGENGRMMAWIMTETPDL